MAARIVSKENIAEIRHEFVITSGIERPHMLMSTLLGHTVGDMRMEKMLKTRLFTVGGISNNGEGIFFNYAFGDSARERLLIGSVKEGDQVVSGYHGYPGMIGHYSFKNGTLEAVSTFMVDWFG